MSVGRGVELMSSIQHLFFVFLCSESCYRTYEKGITCCSVRHRSVRKLELEPFSTVHFTASSPPHPSLLPTTHSLATHQQTPKHNHVQHQQNPRHPRPHRSTPLPRRQTIRYRVRSPSPSPLSSHLPPSLSALCTSHKNINIVHRTLPVPSEPHFSLARRAR